MYTNPKVQPYSSYLIRTLAYKICTRYPDGNSFVIIFFRTKTSFCLTGLFWPRKVVSAEKRFKLLFPDVIALDTSVTVLGFSHLHWQEREKKGKYNKDFSHLQYNFQNCIFVQNQCVTRQRPGSSPCFTLVCCLCKLVDEFLNFP